MKNGCTDYCQIVTKWKKGTEEDLNKCSSTKIESNYISTSVRKSNNIVAKGDISYIWIEDADCLIYVNEGDPKSSSVLDDGKDSRVEQEHLSTRGICGAQVYPLQSQEMQLKEIRKAVN